MSIQELNIYKKYAILKVWFFKSSNLKEDKHHIILHKISKRIKRHKRISIYDHNLSVNFSLSISIL